MGCCTRLLLLIERVDEFSPINSSAGGGNDRIAILVVVAVLVYLYHTGLIRLNAIHLPQPVAQGIYNILEELPSFTLCTGPNGQGQQGGIANELALAVRFVSCNPAAVLTCSSCVFILGDFIYLLSISNMATTHTSSPSSSCSCPSTRCSSSKP